MPNAVELYLAGESVLALSKRYGVARSSIDRHLRLSGVTLRTASEQNRVSAARATPEGRLARAASAHAAVRGRPRSRAVNAATALTREARGEPESNGEVKLLGWLRERGQDPRCQVAVDAYNLDFTLANVAVEVLGGEWHRYKIVHQTRTKVILDAGWHVLFVWDVPNYPISSAAADYAVAFAEESRRDPAAVREYRVIRGDGEFIASGRADDYQLTYIPAARSGMSASEVGRLGCAVRWARAKGRDERVARDAISVDRK